MIDRDWFQPIGLLALFAPERQDFALDAPGKGWMVVQCTQQIQPGLCDQTAAGAD
jgi:hypothetical protein